MVHHPDRDLLVGAVPGQERQVAPVGGGALERDHVRVGGEQVRQRPLVGGPLPVERLLVRIAPAGVQPDLGVHARDLPIHRLRVELQITVGRARSPCNMMLGLLDLDDPAARRRHLAQLRVEDVGEGEDHVAVAAIVAVHQHLGQGLRGDGPELHRSRGEPLRGLEERRVLQRPAAERLAHHRGLVGLHHLVEDVPGAQRAPAPAGRTVLRPRDAAQALDHVVEPRLAAHREIEARVAVGDQVEASQLLLAHQARHRVQVLLTEARIAQCVLEGPTAQLLGEPVRARVGAGDGGGQDQVAGGVEHGPTVPRRPSSVKPAASRARPRECTRAGGSRRRAPRPPRSCWRRASPAAPACRPSRRG